MHLVARILINLLKKGSFSFFALSRLSAKLFDDSKDMSYPYLANNSTNSYTSFYLGVGCLLRIAKLG